jgi:DNA helicase IV
MDAHEELAAERRRLEYARHCLVSSREEIQRMAERARQRPGDGELADWLARRAFQLRDEDKSPLFFGRLDGPEPEPVYIGRRYVTDGRDEPVVIDWRTRLATRFYRASRSEPMEVTRRRRFGFSDDHEMTSYDDEPLVDASPDPGLSQVIVDEIERTRVGPMRDIVATIQPDQDEIVRTELGSTLIIQGGPGTGKTAVGLHRAAYLLYEHAKLRRDGVLVVGPNDTFIRYISKVLPALGESRVVHRSLDQVVAARKAVPEDPAVATLKGDARMSEVLVRALWGTVRMPTRDTLVTATSPYVRITPDTVHDLAHDLVAQRVPVGRARAHLTERLVAHLRRNLEERGYAPGDTEMRRAGRSKPVRELVDSIWPPVTPAKLLFALFSDPAVLSEAADGVLNADEQALLRWDKVPARARWSMADQFLLDEVTALIEDVPGFGHVVIDEAQDLSPIQLRSVMRRCTDSATLLGDMAQRTTPWAAGSWDAVASHLGPASQVLTLTTSYRVPRDIVAVANALLPEISPELPPTVSGRHVPGALEVVECADVPLALLDLLRLAEARPDSVGIITADDRCPAVGKSLRAAGFSVTRPFAVEGTHEDEGGHRFALVPAGLAKGLEFDHVVVLEPQDIVASHDHGTRLLYIALTRAVSKLTILHNGPLPPVLRRQPVSHPDFS